MHSSLSQIMLSCCFSVVMASLRCLFTLYSESPVAWAISFCFRHFVYGDVYVPLHVLNNHVRAPFVVEVFVVQPFVGVFLQSVGYVFLYYYFVFHVVQTQISHHSAQH